MAGMAQRTAVDGKDGRADSRDRMVRILQWTEDYGRDGRENSTGWCRWHRGQQKIVGMAQSTLEAGW